MIRIKRGKNAKNRRQSILKQASGFKGSSHRLYSVGRQKLLKSQIFSYNHRKLRKRSIRQLWIIRLNAFLRISNLTYSQFINQMKLKQIQLNRKIFAQLTLYDQKNLLNFIKKND
uniref:Large ribosomal subunit protein bL20c n=1 Tax=Codium fragile TaxID=3133 RepID=A0A6B9PH74_CODFR|nr:50S ribosomal protein L20 [Codium fragile]